MFGEFAPKPLGNINNTSNIITSLTITGNQNFYNSLFDSFVVYGNSFLNGVVTSQLNTLDDGSSGATLGSIGAASLNFGNASSTTTILGTANINTTGTSNTGIGNSTGIFSMAGSIIGLAAANGVSSIINLGSGSSYTGTIHIADNTGASTVNIGNLSSTLTLLGTVNINNSGSTNTNINTGGNTGTVTVNGNSININANSTGGVFIGNALNSIYLGSLGSLNSIVNIQAGTGFNPTNIGSSGYKGIITLGSASSNIGSLTANYGLFTYGSLTYNTGTISTSGSSTVITGSGTSFSSLMSGGVLLVTSGANVGTQVGVTFVTTTQLTADQSVTIAAGSSYIIYYNAIQFSPTTYTLGNSSAQINITGTLDAATSNMNTLSATSFSLETASTAGMEILNTQTLTFGAFTTWSNNSLYKVYCGIDGSGYVGVQFGSLVLATDSTHNLPIYLTPGHRTTWSLKVTVGSVINTQNNLLDDGLGNLAVSNGIYSTAASGYFLNSAPNGTNYFNIFGQSDGTLVFRNLAASLNPMILGANAVTYTVGPRFATTVPKSYTTTSTVAAADIFNEIIYVPSGTTALTLTFDTGSNLGTAFFPSGVAPLNNQTKLFFIVNQSVNTMTIAGNIGTTLRVSKTTIPGNTMAMYLFYNTGTSTFTVYG